MEISRIRLAKTYSKLILCTLKTNQPSLTNINIKPSYGTNLKTEKNQESICRRAGDRRSRR